MTPPPTPETVDRVIGIVALITGRQSISRHHFLSDLGLDWHDRLSIACEIDELLGTSIPDQEIADWATIADIAATVDHLAPPLPLHGGSTRPETHVHILFPPANKGDFHG